jgi:hypothetical protein
VPCALPVPISGEHLSALSHWLAAVDIKCFKAEATQDLCSISWFYPPTVSVFGSSESADGTTPSEFWVAAGCFGKSASLDIEWVRPAGASLMGVNDPEFFNSTLRSAQVWLSVDASLAATVE